MRAGLTYRDIANALLDLADEHRMQAAEPANVVGLNELEWTRQHLECAKLALEGALAAEKAIAMKRRL